MAESIKISATVPASPKEVYDAWLNGKEHSAFTGEKATGSAKVGSKFTAFGDYIKGKNIELEPHKLIVQAWRTSEFPADAEDSKVELTLKKIRGGTKLTFAQSNIPDGQGSRYQDGWKMHYFNPMKRYFREQSKK
ncbi:MAG: SRPBCC domain-containing protein [Candidatus Kryptoniota bacterium]